MIREDEVYRIGRIGKAHGVKGEVSMHIDDDVFDRVDADYLVVRVDGILVPFFMEEYRFRTNETALLKFCDIDTQEKARELTNCEVFFPRDLSDSDAANPTWGELAGWHVEDSTTHRPVGTIESVDDSTINILFEVRTATGDLVLIPASEELVEGVDASTQTIHIKLPDGILEL